MEECCQKTWRNMANYLARGMRRFAGFVEGLPKDAEYPKKDVELIQAQARRLLQEAEKLKAK